MSNRNDKNLSILSSDTLLQYICETFIFILLISLFSEDPRTAESRSVRTAATLDKWSIGRRYFVGEQDQAGSKDGWAKEESGQTVRGFKT